MTDKTIASYSNPLHSPAFVTINQCEEGVEISLRPENETGFCSSILLNDETFAKLLADINANFKPPVEIDPNQNDLPL